MPRWRLYRWRRNRLARRRYKKALSNYNIATRTGKRAQSHQIYALKSRIDRLYYRYKPQIQIQQRDTYEPLVSTTPAMIRWTSGGSSASALTGIVPQLGNPTSTVQDSTATPSPRLARLKDFTVYGIMHFKSYDNPTPISMRIVFVQVRTSRTNIPDFTDFFTSGSNGSNLYDAVYGPLQNGISRTCNVLFDRVYTISATRQTQRIFIKIKRLLTYYRDANSNTSGTSTSEGCSKGTIIGAYAFYSSDIITGRVEDINLCYKLAFTAS